MKRSYRVDCGASDSSHSERPVHTHSKLSLLRNSAITAFTAPQTWHTKPSVYTRKFRLGSKPGICFISGIRTTDKHEWVELVVVISSLFNKLSSLRDQMLGIKRHCECKPHNLLPNVGTGFLYIPVCASCFLFPAPVEFGPKTNLIVKPYVTPMLQKKPTRANTGRHLATFHQ